MGRPKAAPAHLKNIVIPVRVSETQFKRITKAAREAGTDASTWLRMLGLARAAEGRAQ